MIVKEILLNMQNLKKIQFAIKVAIWVCTLTIKFYKNIFLHGKGRVRSTKIL
jgi:hypothetical protein